jgi:hypothetical protein
VKWEDEMTSLLDSGEVTVANIKKALSPLGAPYANHGFLL